MTSNKPPRKEQQQKQQQKSQKEQQQNEQQQQNESRLGMMGDKPIWNYQNKQGRRALPNSMKDPFYAERAKFVEERRRKRLEYFNSISNQPNLAARTRGGGGQMASQQSQRSDDSMMTATTNTTTMMRKPNTFEAKRQMQASSGTTTTKNSHENNYSAQQKESIMKLLTKNLAANPIMEEDEDLYINNNNNNRNTRGNDEDENTRNERPTNLNKSNSSSIEDMLMSNRGYVPFLRTNEILDPVHAGSPVPPSRESSAIKKGRDRARQVSSKFFAQSFNSHLEIHFLLIFQAYYQNMKPGDYGSYYDDSKNRSKVS